MIPTRIVILLLLMKWWGSYIVQRFKLTGVAGTGHQVHSWKLETYLTSESTDIGFVAQSVAR
ncbi:hypothetical protein [Corynebacterium efficiens YS-314]|uniref:Uncharacterized protein n=1 Tax=Corynebacterium efficiens (strain DSM 44549 / YS-314 / AJ 12310 / JCM 11189 / NBRC 100395) TaxID=196164 RepID=Q8FT64_COREF|nr:hypothetical protein [Corynebacterium efficiens YS-314]